MNVHYIHHYANGKIQRAGSNSPEALELIQTEQGTQRAIVDESVDPTMSYWAGKIVDYPPKPDQWAEFDYEAGSWVSKSDSLGAENDARKQRDALLAASDWTQVPDAPANLKKWKVYRQKLRDITEQKGFPFDVIWPDQPK